MHRHATFICKHKFSVDGIGKYFYVGAGLNNSLFSISNRTKFNAHTKLQLYSGFVRIGYDKYHHGKMFSSFYLNIGYTQGIYTGVLNMDTKPRDLNVKMGFIQPCLLYTSDAADE